MLKNIWLRGEISNFKVNMPTGHMYLTLKDEKSVLKACMFRDFPHIDVIIYELETGRADTLKEALQQADLHIRHGEIKSIVYSATQMICSSIQSNSAKLARTMDLQLSRLNAEIADLNSTQRELSSKFDESIRSQELTNSLLKKANVSSESLAYDMSRIKELNERAYYGH